MIRDLALALGLVAVIEGLVLALAPSRLREALELMRAMPPDQLRLVGLASVTVGVGIVWLARM
jgi:uncharacterized protein